MKQNIRTPRRGFSLIELVIVVVIIAIIAAIAIPKMSRAATGAAESALAQDLSQVRSAIDMYTAEHGGVAPSTTPGTFINQLTLYSDINGTTATAKNTGSGIIYGPYLKAIPNLPVGAAKGNNGVAAATGTGIGWLLNATTGAFTANTTTTELDSAGNAYNTY